MGPDHQYRTDDSESWLQACYGVYGFETWAVGAHALAGAGNRSSSVTVNAICPGYIDDERTRENARAMAEKTGKSVADILKLFAASAPQNRLIAPMKWHRLRS